MLLSAELVERAGPKPLRQRRRDSETPPRGLREEVTHPESMLSSSMEEAREIWGHGTYERLAARFAPVQDQLIELLGVAKGDRVLDLATGTGEVAVRAARSGASVTGIDMAEPMLAKARARAEQDRVAITFDLGDVEYLPYDDARFDVVVSNFGVIFAPDHANVAAELARVSRPGGRLGFTAWKPNPKLGELYRRFTEEPIEGREVFEWGREDHVEDMLGEDFELEFVDGTLWLEADSAEEIWELFSQSAPPVIALLKQLGDDEGEEFHRAFVELYEGYGTSDGGVRVPRRYLLVLGRRK
jgi:SAM-dependent methyltransferase